MSKFAREDSLYTILDGLVRRVTSLERTFTNNVYVTSDIVDLMAGTYTPILTNSENIDSTTAYECQYMRVGNTVTVSGKLNINPTVASGTLTRVGISLPIASNLSADEDLAGTAVMRSTTQNSAVLVADSTNDRVELYFGAQSTVDNAWYFTFTYQII